MKKYLFLLAFILPFMVMGQAWNFPDTPHKGWKRDDHGILTLDTTYLKKDSIVKSWRKVYSFDSGIETQKGYLSASDKKKLDSIPGYVLRCPRDDSEWQTDLVPEHMPIIDGTHQGILNSPLWWEPDTTTFIKLVRKGKHKHVGTGKKKIVKGKHDHAADGSFLVNTYPLAPDAQLPLATFRPDRVSNDAELMTKAAAPDSIVKGYMLYLKKVDSNHVNICFLYGHNAIAHYRVVTTYIIYNNGNKEERPFYDLYKIEVDGKPFDLNKYYQFIPESQVVE